MHGVAYVICTHAQERPPSSTITWPSTYDPAGLANQMAVPAMSSSLPGLLRGTSSPDLETILFGFFGSFIALGKYPGAMALTLIPI